MSATFPERLPRGFSMMSAIFLVVVLALLAAGMAKFTLVQHTTSTLDLQGTRALQAARAGVEWGLYRILDPDTTPSAVLPSCWAGSASITLAQDLAPYSTTVSCSAVSTTEDSNNITTYRIIATASLGTAGTQYYVERQLDTTVTRCATSTSPFTC